MSEGTEKKNKTLIIAIIVATVVIIAGLVTVIVLLLSKEDVAHIDDGKPSVGLINYQQGVIAVDVKSFQEEFDQAVREMQESSIGLLFNNYAVSNDGVSFKCYIGNAESNTKDMYFNIYKDTTFAEQILLTGLIPPGSGIDTFESEIDLEPGTYEAVLVLTQVDDDHSTILGQTNVEIKLYVKG